MTNWFEQLSRFQTFNFNEQGLGFPSNTNALNCAVLLLQHHPFISTKVTILLWENKFFVLDKDSTMSAMVVMIWFWLRFFSEFSVCLLLLLKSFTYAQLTSMSWTATTTNKNESVIQTWMLQAFCSFFFSKNICVFRINCCSWKFD